MATGQFTGEIDFGAFPGSNEASVTITGQTGISPTSKVEVFFMADDTTTGTGAHTAADHRYAPLFIHLSCGAPSGTDIPIYGRCLDKMQGKFTFRGVWAD